MLQRLKEYIDHKNVKISAFEKSVGMSNASLAKPLRKGGSIGVDKLINILETYADLNPIWLLTGREEMLLKSKGVEYIEEERTSQVAEDPAPYGNGNVVAELNKRIQELERLVKEKDIRIEEKDKQIIEKDLQIREMLQFINKK